jgi:TetR/AcrR family transcriptional regulator
VKPESPSPPRSKPEDSRGAILRAAIAEFAEQGEAGARTDAIARAAGVNKALLHYYFGTKDALYGAVLDEVFTGLAERFLQVINGPGTPGERLLRYFLAHFDQLAGSNSFARVLGHELMRARAGQPTRISQIVTICFGPLHAALCAAVAEGMATGELRRVEPGNMVLSLTGVNVFYFISAPFFREISGKDPRDPDMLARQRVALLDFAATLLFSDPGQGRLLAERIQSPRNHSPRPGTPAATRGESS